LDQVDRFEDLQVAPDGGSSAGHAQGSLVDFDLVILAVGLGSVARSFRSGLAEAETRADRAEMGEKDLIAIGASRDGLSYSRRKEHANPEGEANRCYVGAISLRTKSGGKRNRPSVRGRTKAEVKDKLNRLHDEIAAGIRTPAAGAVSTIEPK
jgi:hypothetical protein